MRHPVLTLRRSDLVRAYACDAWLAVFDAVCQERDTDRATGQRVERGPLVRRRDGTTRRDPERLRIELTPLAQVWLALPLSGGVGSAWAWLRARGLVGSVNAPSARLIGAVLRGADLSDADLRDADLIGADLSGANLRDAVLRGAVLRGAVLRDANLRDVDLRGADLSGANLIGALRWPDDAPIPGWSVRNGRLERAS